MNSARITTRDEVDQIMEAYLALPNMRKHVTLARAYGATDADVEGEVVAIVESRSGLNRKDVLRAQIASMQQELTELEQFPPDNFEVGTIIAFEKVYEDRDQVFCYAAIKGTPTLWYLSGLVTTLLASAGTGADRMSRYRVTYEALTHIMRDADNVRVIFRSDGHPLKSSPEQRAALAKVDDFIADPSDGVKVERPERLRSGGIVVPSSDSELKLNPDSPHVRAHGSFLGAEKQDDEPEVNTPVRDPNR